MAVKVEAGVDMKRGDVFFVNPWEVNIKEGLRGRHIAPTEQQVIEMALSLKEHGQRQPVEGRKLVPSNRIQVILGFTRTNAARLIRKGFTAPDGTEHDPDENFLLKVVLTDANDQKAFINNVVENAHRKQTSHIDDAHNQYELRDKYGYDDAEIARLYRCDTGKVGKLRRLLALSDELQMRVHNEGIALDAAVQLASLPEDRQAKVLAASVGENGKVTVANVKAQVAENVMRDAEDREFEAPAPAPPKPKARTLKDLNAWLGVVPNGTRQVGFAEALMGWLRGEGTDQDLQKAFDALA